MIIASNDKIGRLYFTFFPKRVISRDGRELATIWLEKIMLLEEAPACTYWRTVDGREWVEHTGH